GTQNFGNPFSYVANNYPKYRDRSGRIESTEFRINECMQRSMNGKPLDSLSTEMRAFVAYVKWVGNNVPKGIRPKGAGPGKLPILDRAADPERGKLVYTAHCNRCHGDNGQGIFNQDSTAYLYPPLWGDHSFNVSAGLLRLSGLSAFIRNNMPFGVTYRKPELTEEEAWDVAAYISSKPRPQIFFSYDWKDLKKKPFDYPFGPYTDNFSEQQHRYGPFTIMLKEK
ncbi:MAG: c-type cytochrome, partial [Flavisolibacter sp.]